MLIDDSTDCGADRRAIADTDDSTDDDSTDYGADTHADRRSMQRQCAGLRLADDNGGEGRGRMRVRVSGGICGRSERCDTVLID